MSNGTPPPQSCRARRCGPSARELCRGEQKEGPSPRTPAQRAGCPARQSFAIEAPSTSRRHHLQEPRLSGAGRGACRAHVLPARARLAGLYFSLPSASAPAPPNSSSRAKTRSTMTSFIKGSTPAASQIRTTPSRSMPRSSALLASRAIAEMSASTSPFAFAASSSTSTRSCLPVPSLKLFLLPTQDLGDLGLPNACLLPELRLVREQCL